MNNTILFIGAHCDDIETLAGGIFARFSNAGYKCIYIITANSPHYNPTAQEVKDRKYPSNDKIIERRTQEAMRGAEILGACETYFFNFKSTYYYTPGSLDRMYLDGLAYEPEKYEYLIKNVSGRELLVTAMLCEKSISDMADFINDKNPAMIFTHTPSDVHPEHYATAMLVRRALKRLKRKNTRLFAFEDGSFDPVISYKPSHIVDISGVMDVKLNSMDVFQTQCTDQKTGFFKDFYTAHNAFWGSLIGVEYAESFTEFEPFLVYNCEDAMDFKRFRDSYIARYGGKNNSIPTIEIQSLR